MAVISGFPLGVAVANQFQSIADLINWYAQQRATPAAPAAPPLTPPPGSQIVPPGSQTVPAGNVLPSPVFNTTPPVIPQATAPPPAVPLPTPNGNPNCPILWPTDSAYLHNLPSVPNPLPLTPAIPTTANPVPAEFPGGGFLIVAEGKPIEQSDQLRFRAFGTAGAVPVSFFGRVATQDGILHPFNYSLTTDASSTLKTQTIQPGAGMLLNVSASVPLGSITNGYVYAIAELGNVISGTFVPHTLLLTGQVTDQAPLSSNLASPTQPTTQAAFFEAATTDPAGTSQTVTITPPAGRRMRVLNVFCNWSTSAVASTRGFSVGFLNGAQVVARYEAAPFVAASQFGLLRATAGGPGTSTYNGTAGVSQGLFITLPEAVYFTQAITVVVRIDIPSAGDQITNMVVDYEVS
jgi:hypothetical protein